VSSRNLVIFTVYLPATTRAGLRQLALTRGISASAMVAAAIDRLLIPASKRRAIKVPARRKVK
jgi:hypothetical protein